MFCFRGDQALLPHSEFNFLFPAGTRTIHIRDLQMLSCPVSFYANCLQTHRLVCLRIPLWLNSRKLPDSLTFHWMPPNPVSFTPFVGEWSAYCSLSCVTQTWPFQHIWCIFRTHGCFQLFRRKFLSKIFPNTVKLCHKTWHSCCSIEVSLLYIIRVQTQVTLMLV